MPIRNPRRALLWALLAAALLGFFFGWYARLLYSPSEESRARDTADRIRERVRDLTH
jgi:hypothetical protein